MLIPFLQRHTSETMDADFDPEEYRLGWKRVKEKTSAGPRVAAKLKEHERLIRGKAPTQQQLLLEQTSMDLQPRKRVAVKQEQQPTIIDLTTETDVASKVKSSVVEQSSPPAPTTTTERCYPLRNRRPTKRLIEDKSFFMSPKQCIFMGQAVLQRWRTTQTDYRYIVALLTSLDTLGLEGVDPAIAQFPLALKASAKDPDSPSLQEAMTGPYREEFLEATRTEISELESHNCWDVIAKEHLPEGVKLLPTWTNPSRHPLMH
jgi:hypothetical protein